MASTAITGPDAPRAEGGVPPGPEGGELPGPEGGELPGPEDGEPPGPEGGAPPGVPQGPSASAAGLSGTVLSGSPGCAAADDASSLVSFNQSAGVVAPLWP